MITDNKIYFGLDNNNSTCIIKCDMDVLNHVREHFSVENTQARFQRRYARFTPKRHYAITQTGRFLPGLYFNIRKFLKDEYPTHEISVAPGMTKVILPQYEITDLASLSLDLRDYQKEIVHKCLKFGRGVVVLATAGGKTLTMACLIESIFKKVPDNLNTFKCLVVVPTLNLVHQSYKDFQDYNVSFTFTKWTGNDTPELDANVIIANTGILQSDNTNIEYITDTDLLIVDEVHMLRKNNKISKLIKKINTPNKYGLTGTMPDDQLDQWNIYGTIGPKVYEKNSKQLRDEEYIGKVSVQIVEIDYLSKPEKASDPSQQYRKELQFISKNAFRTSVIEKICKPLKNNCLIMVDYIEHGQTIYDKLTVNNTDNKQIYYIKGDVDIEDREYIRGLMEKNNDVTVVAISKIFSTGINIKNLHYIVFAGGGKAKIKIIQSIGRGLRLHQGEKNLIIIDLADNLKYGVKHAAKRKQLYNNEKIRYKISKTTETKKETG